MAYVVFKYQALYVFVNDYESGGMFLSRMLNRTVACMVASQVALALYFCGYREFYPCGVLLLPLAISCFMLGSRYHKAYRMEELPYNIAIYIDQKLEARNQSFDSNGAHKSFSETLYMQPSLTALPAVPEESRFRHNSGPTDESDPLWCEAEDLEKDGASLLGDGPGSARGRSQSYCGQPRHVQQRHYSISLGGERNRRNRRLDLDKGFRSSRPASDMDDVIRIIASDEMDREAREGAQSARSISRHHEKKSGIYALLQSETREYVRDDLDINIFWKADEGLVETSFSGAGFDTPATLPPGMGRQRSESF
uniref:CSC1/OSCA1-like 7TM region domain-containing protein n=1 Tax=Octactis speculum TaxID=3111310 RepID=A0A7S2DEM7_9STRA|mmetsp:Transcript_47785/g.65075  ORF Transcript_47785/g.65075 Transcript_47785/m.65075 type:complete len:310 (+) Transcript_47785:1-930(+)